jgi:hypothetical protein
MLLVAEVVREFAVEGALNERFGELLEESVLAEQVTRLPVFIQQFVEQFGSDRLLAFLQADVWPKIYLQTRDNYSRFSCSI